MNDINELVKIYNDLNGYFQLGANYPGWLKDVYPVISCARGGVPMEIKIIESNKKDFLDLLLLADEQESMIDKYLDRGKLFALYDAGLKSICVVTDEGGGSYEIQNLATYMQFQSKGYGKKLVRHIFSYYKDKGNTILVGTGDIPWIVSFYQRCGFVYSHRLENYFLEHYDNTIFEAGIQLKDKIYLKVDLDAV